MLGDLAHPRQLFLHRGEAAGVEEAAQQLRPVLGVGAQEAREVALRQQHHLAELLPAHAEQLADLLADLLVGAAEALPVAAPASYSRSQVWAFSAVMPVPRFLGRRCSGRRVISSRRPPTVRSRTTSVRVPGAAWSLRRVPARLLAGAGHAAVEGVAHGVEDRGLARAGRPRAAGRARRRRARRSRPCGCRANGPKAVRVSRCSLTAPPCAAMAGRRLPLCGARPSPTRPSETASSGADSARPPPVPGPASAFLGGLRPDAHGRRSPRRSAGRCGPSAAGRRRRGRRFRRARVRRRG